MRLITRLALGGALLLGGCESMIKHNDVLIFGTTTNFGIDVSSAGGTTGSPTPSITIGYKRSEAVWMPLVANAAEAGATWKPNVCPSGAAPCVPFDELKYVGHGEKKAGSEDSEGDAYSVLASFGAKGGATASSAPSANLGLAQFFATGVAAQRLASNAAVSQVLSIQDPAAAAAGAKAAAISSAVDSGKPDIVAAVALGTTMASADQALADRAAACATKKGTEAFAAQLPAGKAQTEAKSATTSAAMLHIIDVWANSADIEKATTTLCP